MPEISVGTTVSGGIRAPVYPAQQPGSILQYEFFQVVIVQNGYRSGPVGLAGILYLLKSVAESQKRIVEYRPVPVKQ